MHAAVHVLAAPYCFSPTKSLLLNVQPAPCYLLTTMMPFSDLTTCT